MQTCSANVNPGDRVYLSMYCVSPNGTGAPLSPLSNHRFLSSNSPDPSSPCSPRNPRKSVATTIATTVSGNRSFLHPCQYSSANGESTDCVLMAHHSSYGAHPAQHPRCQMARYIETAAVSTCTEPSWLSHHESQRTELLSTGCPLPPPRLLPLLFPGTRD